MTTLERLIINACKLKLDEIDETRRAEDLAAQQDELVPYAKLSKRVQQAVVDYRGAAAVLAGAELIITAAGFQVPDEPAGAPLRKQRTYHYNTPSAAGKRAQERRRDLATLKQVYQTQALGVASATKTARAILDRLGKALAQV
jgi:hypothetical protein